MKTALVVLVTLVALVGNAVASPRKVLVLPLDGNAPAEQKAQLVDTIAKLAKSSADGEVTIGDTTFSETAAAFGCDPAAPTCAETVRSTLAVDELVYGKTTTANGTTTVVVYRATPDTVPTARTAVIAETDTGDKAEPVLAPAFGLSSATAETAGTDGGSVTATTEPQPRGNFFDTRERRIGFGLAGGGVIAAVIGFSLWASASSMIDQIEDHPRTTLAQFQDLQELEDRAGTRALWGNILVGVGVGLGVVGGWYLYKDHQKRGATLAPAPAEAGTGMTLVFAGRW
jgi:hypothetical protein